MTNNVPANIQDSQNLESQIEDRIKDYLDQGMFIDDIAIKLDVSIEKIKEIQRKDYSETDTTSEEVKNPKKLFKRKLEEIIQASDIAFMEYKLYPSLDNQMNLTSFIKSAKEVLDQLNSMFDGQEVSENLVNNILKPLLESIIKLIYEKLKEAEKEFGKYMNEQAQAMTKDFVERTMKTLGREMLDSYTKSLEEIEKLMTADLKNLKPEKRNVSNSSKNI